MKLKFVTLMLCMFFVTFGATLQAKAAEVDSNATPVELTEELPEGVELYYPTDPSMLMEYYKTDAQRYIESYSSIAASKKVELTSNEKTDSTQRIYVDVLDSNHAGLTINVDFKKFGSMGTGVYTLFKNGSYYQSWAVYSTGQKGMSVNLPHGEYSLRLYCGNPDEKQTGCSADATISIFWKAPWS